MSGIFNPFDYMELAKLERLINCASDGNATISANTAMSKAFYLFNDLTVNSGVNFYATSKEPHIIIVKNTLTLNGTISNQCGGAGGVTYLNWSVGGQGGGVLIICAKNITGNGVISVAGNNGGNGTNKGSGSQSSGNNGADTIFRSKQYKGGGGGGLGSGGGNGGAPSLINILSLLFPLFYTDIDFTNDEGGAGGGSGGYTYNTETYVGGGGGGAGIVGAGGNGRSRISNYSSTGIAGGGGGGGGGALIVYSENAISGITLSAAGGNGGNSNHSEAAGGGGGGGGGLVVVYAPSCSATINVAGGSVGSGGTGGSAGSAGTSYVFS